MFLFFFEMFSSLISNFIVYGFPIFFNAIGTGIEPVKMINLYLLFVIMTKAR